MLVSLLESNWEEAAHILGFKPSEGVHTLGVAGRHKELPCVLPVESPCRLGPAEVRGQLIARPDRHVQRGSRDLRTAATGARAAHRETGHHSSGVFPLLTEQSKCIGTVRAGGEQSSKVGERLVTSMTSMRATAPSITVEPSPIRWVLGLSCLWGRSIFA